MLPSSRDACWSQARIEWSDAGASNIRASATHTPGARPAQLRRTSNRNRTLIVTDTITHHILTLYPSSPIRVHSTRGYCIVREPCAPHPPSTHLHKARPARARLCLFVHRLCPFYLPSSARTQQRVKEHFGPDTHLPTSSQSSPSSKMAAVTVNNASCTRRVASVSQQACAFSK